MGALNYRSKNGLGLIYEVSADEPLRELVYRAAEEAEAAALDAGAVRTAILDDNSADYQCRLEIVVDEELDAGADVVVGVYPGYYEGIYLDFYVECDTEEDILWQAQHLGLPQDKANQAVEVLNECVEEALNRLHEYAESVSCRVLTLLGVMSNGGGVYRVLKTLEEEE